MAAALAAGEKSSSPTMITAQRKPTTIGGYYQPDDKLASAALRPSKTLNDIIASI